MIAGVLEGGRSRPDRGERRHPERTRLQRAVRRRRMDGGGGRRERQVVPQPARDGGGGHQHRGGAHGALPRPRRDRGVFRALRRRPAAVRGRRPERRPGRGARPRPGRALPDPHLRLLARRGHPGKRTRTRCRRQPALRGGRGVAARTADRHAGTPQRPPTPLPPSRSGTCSACRTRRSGVPWRSTGACSGASPRPAWWTACAS